MIKKSSILIDGGNFYFKLKDLKLPNLISFDFKSFNEYLCTDKYQNISSHYYIGAIKTDGTDKTKKLHDSQQKFLKHLSKNNFKYKLGYLLKNNGKFSEKGVDVQMATDILVQSFEKKVNNIFLVSSDTDLIPAVKQSQLYGTTITYVGFKHMPSKAMINACSRYILLDKNIINQFISK